MNDTDWKHLRLGKRAQRHPAVTPLIQDSARRGCLAITAVFGASEEMQACMRHGTAICDGGRHVHWYM